MEKVNSLYFAFWSRVMLALRQNGRVENPFHDEFTFLGLLLSDFTIEEMDAYNAVKDNLEPVFGGEDELLATEIVARTFPALDFQAMHLSEIADICASLSETAEFKHDIEQQSIADNWLRYAEPRDFFSMLDGIYKNDAVKRMVSTAIYNHLHSGISSVNIIIGPTASGKTQIYRDLSSQLSHAIDVVMIDSTKVTQTGYSRNGGNTISDIIKSCDNAHNAVFFWDEFDKLAIPRLATQSGVTVNYSQSLLNECLSLFDGNPINLEGSSESFADYRITHFLMGTFEHVLNNKRDIKSIGFGTDISPSSLTSHDVTIDDLHDAGISREILGRVSSIAYMDILTEDDILALMENPDTSPITKLERMYHKQLNISDSRKRELAKSCLESGLGIRYIRNEIAKEINRSIFEDPDAKSISL